MADRPNFFELLELDPQQTNWPEIAKRIKEKKGAWAKESTMGSPKKRPEAKRNLDLLPEILKVLQDPVLRKQEAEDALRRRGAARKAQEQKLAGWIDLLKGSGTCSAEQFGKICGQFEGIFSEHEIRARFAAVGIRVEAGPAGPKPPRERTDPVTAKNIRQNLELLDLASLYQFLGLAPGSPAERLRARAEEILKEIHRLGRTDALTAARSRLAGTCMTVFQSEEEKKKYDNERLLEAVEAIEDQIKAAAVDKVLSAQEIETLIRLATQRGVPPDEVREVLEERAAKEGWKVERAPAGPAPGEPASPQASTGDGGEPPAPARLIVRPIPGGLRLSWEPVRLSEVRYRVLRKAGSVPWDEGDGTLIAQTSEAQADDATVPLAVPWHYAVFSLKNGLASGVPAHSGPHFVAAADGAAGSLPEIREVSGSPDGRGRSGRPRPRRRCHGSPVGPPRRHSGETDKDLQRAAGAATSSTAPPADTETANFAGGPFPAADCIYIQSYSNGNASGQGYRSEPTKPAKQSSGHEPTLRSESRGLRAYPNRPGPGPGVHSSTRRSRGGRSGGGRSPPRLAARRRAREGAS